MDSKGEKSLYILIYLTKINIIDIVAPAPKVPLHKSGKEFCSVCVCFGDLLSNVSVHVG